MAGFGGPAGPGAMGAGNQGDAASSQGGHGGTSGGSHSGGGGGPHGGHTGNFGGSPSSGSGLGSGHGGMVSGPGGYDSGWGGLSGDLSSVGGIVGPDHMSHMSPDNWGTIVGGTFHGLDHGEVTDALSTAHDRFSLSDIHDALLKGVSIQEIADLAEIGVMDVLGTAFSVVTSFINPLSMFSASLQAFSLTARARGNLNAALAYSSILDTTKIGTRLGALLGKGMLGMAAGLGLGLGLAANKYGLPVGDNRSSFGWGGLSSGTGDGGEGLLYDPLKTMHDEEGGIIFQPPPLTFDPEIAQEQPAPYQSSLGPIKESKGFSLKDELNTEIEKLETKPGGVEIEITESISGGGGDQVSQPWSFLGDGGGVVLSLGLLVGYNTFNSSQRMSDAARYFDGLVTGAYLMHIDEIAEQSEGGYNSFLGLSVKDFLLLEIFLHEQARIL